MTGTAQNRATHSPDPMIPGARPLPAEEVQALLYPTRIVKTGGDVLGDERLLQEKALALVPAFDPAQSTRLCKTGEANPFVVLDYGRELAGGVRLVISHMTPNDRRVRLVFAESVTEALSTVGEQGANNPSAARDTVTVMANLSVRDIGRQGFRFVKIELLDEGELWLKAAVAITRTMAHPQVGYVRTSDERLNTILDTAAYTCFLCAQEGVIWDGIKRDRLIWAGDLNTELLTLTYLWGNLPHAKNSLRILRDEAPPHVWMNGIPAYAVWWMLNLIDYYLLSGDKTFCEESAAYLATVLADLEASIGEASVDFARAGKHAEMPFFLDWPTYGTPDAVTGTLLLTDYTLQKLRRVPLPGMDTPAVYATIDRLLTRLAPHRAVAVHTKQVAALQVLCTEASTAQAPLPFEVTARYAALRDCLEADGARGFSTFMSYFLLSGLDGCGSEKVLDLAKAYYGGMLDRGATTFWEDFSLDWLPGSGRIDEETPAGLRDLHADSGAFCYEGLKHSLCHGWSAGILPFVVERVVGLTPLAPGFARVRIAPRLGSLDFVEAAIPTPHGLIRIRVEAGRTPMVELPRGVEWVE